MRSLMNVKPGNVCTIKWLLGMPEVLEFMERYHIRQGSHVEIIQNRADGLIIGTPDARLALSRDVAERIKV